MMRYAKKTLHALQSVHVQYAIQMIGLSLSATSVAEDYV